MKEKENTLRILDATNNQLHRIGKVYSGWMLKAIPSMDKSKLTGEYALQLAIISRIKLYYRPAKLALPTRSGRRKIKISS